MSNFKNWFKNLISNFGRAFKRFPVACFFAALLTLIVFDNIVTEYNEEPWPSEQVFSACMWGSLLALLLTFAFEFFCTIHPMKLWQRITGTAALVALSAAGGYAFNNISTQVAAAMLFAALIIVLLPMSSSRAPHKVWNYHAKLAVAVIIASILCEIITLSLTGIIFSIDLLFSTNLNTLMEMIFATVFIFLFACCTMSLLPTNIEDYNTQPNPHKLVRILAQYILLPLICIEGIILYIYGITILVRWELPNGGVVGLVFSYAIIGSLIWYLLLPYFLSEKQQWVRFFHRGFFISLLPLLALLFTGLAHRISEYGLTTNRYIVIVISGWFAIVAIIFSIIKLKNVTPLLLSLLLITLLSMFGPWGMSSLPDKMQTKRFETLLNEYHLLHDGHVVAAKEPLSQEQNIALSISLDYFLDESTNKDEFLEKYFGMTQDEIDSNLNVAYTAGSHYTPHDTYSFLMKEMNGTYIPFYSRNPTNTETDRYVNFIGTKPSSKTLFPTDGYNYTFSFTEYHDEKTTHTFTNGQHQVNVTTQFTQNPLIHFQYDDISFSINVLDSLNIASQIPEESSGNIEEDITLKESTIQHKEDKMELMIEFDQVGIKCDTTNQYRIHHLSFVGFMKVEP